MNLQEFYEKSKDFRELINKEPTIEYYFNEFKSENMSLRLFLIVIKKLHQFTNIIIKKNQIIEDKEKIITDMAKMISALLNKNGTNATLTKFDSTLTEVNFEGL